VSRKSISYSEHVFSYVWCSTLYEAVRPTVRRTPSPYISHHVVLLVHLPAGSRQARIAANVIDWNQDADAVRRRLTPYAVPWGASWNATGRCGRIATDYRVARPANDRARTAPARIRRQCRPRDAYNCRVTLQIHRFRQIHTGGLDSGRYRVDHADGTVASIGCLWCVTIAGTDEWLCCLLYVS